jgi:hypothetical protein
MLMFVVIETRAKLLFDIENGLTRMTLYEKGLILATYYNITIATFGMCEQEWSCSNGIRHPLVVLQK